MKVDSSNPAEESHAQSLQNQEGSPTEINSGHRYRPYVIILFAVIILIFASKSKAHDHTYAAQQAISQSGHSILVIDNTNAQVIASAASSAPSFGSGSPKYVRLSANLANFDPDADPDGWEVAVMLFDKNDRLVIPNGRVEFELMPRFATQDYHGYRDAQREPIRWNSKLQYAADGVARAKLELRQDLQPLFGWSSAVLSQSGSRSVIENGRARPLGNRFGGYRNGELPRRTGSTIGNNWRQDQTLPEHGELRVKVSVPGHGVYKAVSMVEIRPSGLVDTKWPYR